MMSGTDMRLRDPSKVAKPLADGTKASICIKNRDERLENALLIVEYSLIALVALIAILVTYHTMGSDFAPTASSSGSASISLK